MAKQIPEGRKAAYYIGIGLSIIGVLLFASVFVTSAAHFGDFRNFQSRAKSEEFRALAGMALIVIGAIISAVGARGLAGSGTVLDLERAREDLEPYSRMVGGMVKCPACGKLNEEDSKFCQECGKPL
jgi:hypothetical protein